MGLQGAEPTAERPALPPQAVMFQMITGKWVSQAIYAAAELGVADALELGVQSIEELSRATNTDADSLYRLLRGLSSVGIFIEKEGRRFHNNPLSETLRRNTPGSIRGFARLMGMEMAWKAWGELVYSVQTGRPAFDHVAGESTFEYIGARPDQAEIINEAMTSLSELASRAVVDAYDFSGARVIVDVGGGHGLLLATILRANPQAKGVLYELPHAFEGATRLFVEHGLTERVEVVAGDALEWVAPGGDVYLMKHIVHDWDDERSIRFLENCAAAMQSGGKLLVVEAVLTPPGVPHFAKLLDLEMLIMSAGGRERTVEEYERLYAAAGLTVTGVHATHGPHSIIEGVKP